MKPILLILLLALSLASKSNASGPPIVRIKSAEQGISYRLENLNARTEKDAKTLEEVKAWLREAVSEPEELVIVRPDEGASFRAVLDVLRLVKAAGAKWYSVQVVDARTGVPSSGRITGKTDDITPHKARRGQSGSDTVRGSTERLKRLLIKINRNSFLAVIAVVGLAACHGPKNNSLESFHYDVTRGATVEVDFKRVKGVHGVGVVCSQQVAADLFKSIDVQGIRVEIVASENGDARIVRDPPGSQGTVGDSIPNWHHLFTLSTTGATKVRLWLPRLTSMPAGADPVVQIVVAKSPAQANEPISW